MQREQILAFALRAICFGYGAVSLACVVFVLGHRTGFRLPASLDPSLVISPLWTAVGIVSQAVVLCAFLTALAESVRVDVPDYYADGFYENANTAPANPGAPERMSSGGKAYTPGSLVDAQKQVVA